MKISILLSFLISLATSLVVRAQRFHYPALAHATVLQPVTQRIEFRPDSSRFGFSPRRDKAFSITTTVPMMMSGFSSAYYPHFSTNCWMYLLDSDTANSTIIDMYQISRSNPSDDRHFLYPNHTYYLVLESTNDTAAFSYLGFDTIRDYRTFPKITILHCGDSLVFRFRDFSDSITHYFGDGLFNHSCDDGRARGYARHFKLDCPRSGYGLIRKSHAGPRLLITNRPDNYHTGGCLSNYGDYYIMNPLQYLNNIYLTVDASEYDLNDSTFAISFVCIDSAYERLFRNCPVSIKSASPRRQIQDTLSTDWIYVYSSYESFGRVDYQSTGAEQLYKYDASFSNTVLIVQGTGHGQDVLGFVDSCPRMTPPTWTSGFENYRFYGARLSETPTVFTQIVATGTRYFSVEQGSATTENNYTLNMRTLCAPSEAFQFPSGYHLYPASVLLNTYRAPHTDRAPYGDRSQSTTYLARADTGLRLQPGANLYKLHYFYDAAGHRPMRYAWYLDANGDGDFADPGEFIAEDSVRADHADSADRYFIQPAGADSLIGREVVLRLRLKLGEDHTPWGNGCEPYDYGGTIDFISKMFSPFITVNTRPKNSVNAFSIYPNPAHGHITLHFATAPQPGQAITIYAADGRLLLTQPLAATATQAVSLPLPVGLYTIRAHGYAQQMVLQ